MKCTKCEFEAPKKDFKYLYAPAAAATTSFRLCPQCGAWLEVDDLAEETKEREAQKVFCLCPDCGARLDVDSLIEEMREKETQRA